MLTPSVKISPSMVVSTVYLWLERYARNEVTLSHVLHHIDFELGAVKAHFDEDRWMDILEHIETRPNGWDEVKAEWLRVKSVSLLQDKRAWRVIQTWIYGGSNLALVSEVMQIAYGDRYIHADWEDIFHHLQEVWETEEEEENPETRQIFQEILDSQGLSLPPPPHYNGDAPLPASLKAPTKSQKKTPNNLCSLDMGVIDLTVFRADSEDDNIDAGPSKPPKKQRKIDISRSIDHFLDTSALDDEEEEDYSGDDTLMARPSEVLPGGLASFASRVDDICHLYSGRANHVHDTSHDPLHRSPLSTSQALPRVYKVKSGIYRNDVGYMLSRDGDQVSILVAPRQRPYDSGHQKLLFDADAARLAGYAITLDPSDTRAGVMSCDGLIYHKGLLRCSLLKKTLEVVELPHPDDLVLHSLAGIDPPLIHQTIKMFSAQFWQQGDLVCITEGELFNMSATILSVNFQNKSASVVIDSNGTLPVQHSCPISSLQRTYRCGHSVKVFAGSDRGTEGCVVDHSGENIILTVHRTGEIIEIQVDPLLIHTFTPAHRIAEDTIQIGDYATILHGPQRGLRGTIHNETPSIPEGVDPWCLHIHKDEAVIDPPSMLKFSSQNGYDGCTVLNVDFLNASMVIRHEDFTLRVHISSCTKVHNWTPLSLHRGSEVWIIAGDKKGHRANLVSLGRQLSVVSMLGYPHYEIKNVEVATSTGYLLNGDKLDDVRLHALMALQRKSFVQEPPNLDKTTDDPWVISASDLSSASPFPPPSTTPPAVNKGNIAWLFDDAFCRFTDFCVCLNVGIGYNRGSLCKRVVYTTCPDRFLGPEGPVLPSQLCSTRIQKHLEPRWNVYDSAIVPLIHIWKSALFVQPQLPSSASVNMATATNDLGDMMPLEMLEEMALRAELAVSGGANGHNLREMTREEKACRKQKIVTLRIAVDPQTWEKERENAELIAAEQEDNAPVSQLDSERDKDDKKLTKPKKRKRESDAAVKPKAKTKPKSDKKVSGQGKLGNGGINCRRLC
ncbi:hypothetical protein SCLCIDRAFT_22646 [Scleroderma citrinum Foug A]|uniref:KOW domain-containing protein n=1 Tax=Scleroderma citrinum Foug A TaxID=1036808 RepID=A0A0C2ZVC9_9AGAM|nr:hypothetical protein SCLCIDRAFT_22646 [Scleroderma citrinum Foug A]